MKKMSLYFLAAISLVIISCNPAEKYRVLSMEEYKSKMKAGWLGQMAGVGWGASTEFKFNAMIIPEDQVPAWEPQMINQHYQDDIYVEMTFLKTLEDYGFDVSIRQAGIDFANSKYMLWHANLAGRENLRAGIAPPWSGHPEYNAHADDIDYQIEADYSGLIAPGLPQTVIDLADIFGRLMNYGDGVYGGIFVGAMYAEAFFETDIHKIIEAGLACIPQESQYAEAIRDVIRWHSENSEDWQKTWQLIEDKYNLNPEYRKFSCNGTETDFNIDAKLNGAYIVMGLLYGEGDMDRTIQVSMRCGMDSDCNPSNAAGILATSLGLDNLPEKYKAGIDDSTKFSFTAYDFPSLLNVCEALARDAVVRAGGRIEMNSAGSEEFRIPVQSPVVPELTQCWEAEEITGEVHFSAEEMDRIKVRIRKPEDYVKVWKVAGPFRKEGVEDLNLFDLKFGPEVDPHYMDWSAMPVGESGYEANLINLEKRFGTIHSVAYLKTSIRTESAQKVLFELGSDDGIKVWLNDELIHSKNILRGHNQAEDVIEADLEEGWNTFMMKVTQGTGGWGASLVITDLDGELVEGLEYKAID